MVSRTWVERPCDERLALAVAQRTGLCFTSAKALAARGNYPGSSLDSVEAWLACEMPWPDPYRLHHMRELTERVGEAILNDVPIGLLGDYDVDGATSCAVLYRYLQSLQRRCLVHIPDRFTEGYGPNLGALENLKRRGAGLILTLDCGTNAATILTEARTRHIEVHVLDHHLQSTPLPPGILCVNPHQVQDQSGFTYLAAVGLCFLFVMALERYLEQNNFFQKLGAKPDIHELLDMVALGTVCDIVPLVALNRMLVARGLSQSSRTPGMQALIQVCDIREKLDAEKLGFQLGPRINAGGRMGLSRRGFELLVEDDPAQAQERAFQLSVENERRRTTERMAYLEAVDQLEASAKVPPTQRGAGGFILLKSATWSPGVLGLIAGRLARRYALPALVVHWDVEKQIGTGSGRSVPGVPLGSIIGQCATRGVLLSGGGHQAAVGFKLKCDRWDDFCETLVEAFRPYAPTSKSGAGAAAQDVSEAESGVALSWRRPSVLKIDAYLDPQAVTRQLAQNLARLGPFGRGFPEPCYGLAGVQPVYLQEIGTDKQHLRLRVQKDGAQMIQALFFNAAEHETKLTMGRFYNLAGYIRVNHWGGSARPEFFIEDVQQADRHAPL